MENIVRSGTSIFQVLEFLDKQPPGRQFAVVVGKHDIIAGTLTDGDIRRALLQGKSLDGVVDDFINPNPIVGQVADSTTELDQKLLRLNTGVHFLPVVDNAGTLCDVRFFLGKKVRGSQALIMAGGFGTRLGKITREIPKPLVKYRGKPLIQHVLSRLELSEVSKIYVSVFYLAEQIEHYLEAYQSSKNITVLAEAEPLGTAGAISLVPIEVNNDIIVTNSDVVSEVDFNALLEFHRSNNFDVTIAVAMHSVQIPFGVIQHDTHGGFQAINEKPVISNRIAAGIYCLKSELIKDLEIRGYLDMPALLGVAKEKNKNLGIFPMHEGWRDVGTPEDLV